MWTPSCTCKHQYCLFRFLTIATSAGTSFARTNMFLRACVPDGQTQCHFGKLDDIKGFSDAETGRFRAMFGVEGWELEVGGWGVRVSGSWVADVEQFALARPLAHTRRMHARREGAEVVLDFSLLPLPPRPPPLAPFPVHASVSVSPCFPCLPLYLFLFAFLQPPSSRKSSRHLAAPLSSTCTRSKAMVRTLAYTIALWGPR